MLQGTDPRVFRSPQSGSRGGLLLYLPHDEGSLGDLCEKEERKARQRRLTLPPKSPTSVTLGPLSDVPGSHTEASKLSTPCAGGPGNCLCCLHLQCHLFAFIQTCLQASSLCRRLHIIAQLILQVHSVQTQAYSTFTLGLPRAQQDGANGEYMGKTSRAWARGCSLERPVHCTRWAW